MKRFVNSKRTEYHHETIVEASDSSRLLTSGVARGFSSGKYSWLADFLFKQPENFSLNKHKCSISFFSDREIFYQEYGNVSRIYDQYPFVSEYDRKDLSPHTFELTTKQYSKVGQRGGEFDVVEYLNLSHYTYEAKTANLDPQEQLGLIPFPIELKHEFYRSPCHVASGFKLDMEFQQTLENQRQYFDRYIWINPNISRTSVYERETDVYYATSIPSYNDGNEYTDDQNEDQNTISTLVRRVVDSKLSVNNARFKTFEEPMHEWVFYHETQNSYYGNRYYPYVGIVSIYNYLWNELYPENTSGVEDPYTAFFPEVIQNGILEPAKAIVNWGYVGENKRNGPKQGLMTYEPINSLNEPDDQSRIVYNICRRLINMNDDGDGFLVQRKDDADKVIYAGIDVETERNRRYSAVVMTEPYFVTKPILSGTLIDYKFVDYKGDDIHFNSENEFTSRPAVYLRVKAPKSVISEIDRLLSLDDRNTDIIETFDIKGPSGFGALITPAASDYYENISGDFFGAFYRRQDDCLDDLINEPVGGGTHKEFWMSATGLQNEDKYSGNGVKICGLGYICKTQLNPDGTVNEFADDYLRLYCTNHAPKSCYDKGDGSGSSVPNELIEFITDNSLFYSRGDNEVFRPMIKLSGMNGYIKILERDKNFKITRAPDGQYEVTYIVEFPYCPGSYFERAAMKFDGYETTQILYKDSYINAGSEETTIVGSDKRYDVANERFAPYGNDSFVRHEVFEQFQRNGYIETNPSRGGGGIEFLTPYEKSRIRYPSSLVWNALRRWQGLSLIKPQEERFRRYGTYELKLGTVDYGGVDTPFEITDDGATGDWVSGYFGYADDLGKNLTIGLEIESTGAKFGSDIETEGVMDYQAECTDDPDSDIAAVRVTIPFDNYDIYIVAVEVISNSVVVEYTDFESGMNGWEQVVGSGMVLTTDPNGSGAVLRPAGSGADQVLQKQLDSSLSTSNTIQVKVTLHFPLDNDFYETIWSDTNIVRVDAMPYNGRGYGGTLAPRTDLFTVPSDGKDHFIVGTTVSNEGATIFPKDIKLLSFADNRKWSFGDSKYSSYVGRENPSYICEVDINSLLNDFASVQASHNSIPEMKRWLYSYFSGFAHATIVPEKDEYITDNATDQVGTLPIDGVRSIPSTESQSDVIIEIWDGESDVGNGETGNWRPFIPTRFDSDKVPGNLILDGLHKDEGTPVEVIPGKIYKIYLSYYTIGAFEFPEFVKYGTDEDIINGKGNLVLYDKINKVWYHVAYINAESSPTKSNSYAAYVRMSATDDIPGFGLTPPDGLGTVNEESLTPVDFWPLRLHYPRTQISKNPLSDFYTEEVNQGSDQPVKERYVDISDLVNGLRSGNEASNRYVDENGKVKFRIRLSKLKKTYDFRSGKDNVIVNVSHESEDVSEIQYVGEEIPNGNEWVNYPWTSDQGATFDEGFDFSKVLASEIAQRLGMTYFKCTSR